MRARWVILGTMVGLLAVACSAEVDDAVTSTSVDLGTSTTAPVDVDAGSPAQRAGAGMAAGSFAVLFGGFDDNRVAVGDTWELLTLDDGWVAQSALVAPEARGFHSMTAVDSLDGVVMVGGSGSDDGTVCTVGNCLSGAFFNDMWLYRSSSGWELLERSTPLGLRQGHGAVYDPVSDSIVFFGGMLAPEGSATTASLMADTWVYSVGDRSWSEVEVDQSSPAARAFHQMVYHPPSGSMLMWGGFLGGSESDQTMWRFDPGARTWEAFREPASAPAGRWYHALMYDPASGGLVLTGGMWFASGSRAFGDDVWLFSAEDNAWEPRADIGGAVLRPASTTLGDAPMLFVDRFTAQYESGSDSWTWLEPVETD